MASSARTTAFCTHTELRDFVKDASHLFNNNLAVPVWGQVFSDLHANSCKFKQPEGPEGRIHRLFAKSNFSRLSAISGLEKPIETWLDPKWTVTDTFYDRIRPALVLATRLLEETGEFFDTVLLGKIQDRRNGRFYALEEGLTEGPSFFPEGHSSLKKFQIFTGYNEESCEEAHATAQHGMFPQKGSQRLATQAIQLNTRHTTFFTHAHYDLFTGEVKQRILFMLAVTLVHELAHVWYDCRMFDYMRQVQWIVAKCLRVSEPFFTGEEPEPELGLSWESFAFGCRPEPYWPEDRGRMLPYALVTDIACHPYRKFTTEERKGTFAARALTSQEIAAFLNADSWKLFQRLRPGGDLQCYKDVAGNNVLEVMSTVAFMEEFKATSGCYPRPEEISVPEPRVIIHLTHFPPIYNYECSGLSSIYDIFLAYSDPENEEPADGTKGTEYSTKATELNVDPSIGGNEDDAMNARECSANSPVLTCDDDKESLNGIDRIPDGTHCVPTPPPSPSFEDGIPDYSEWWAALGQQAKSNPLHQAARGGRMTGGRGGTRRGHQRNRGRYQR
ncbi:hypothetical protein EDD37DRAFT_608231 [Exophiala viscosa]|uniref:uncharacterized protein n=1 Tax=Exophiala viscosa TaxID=2486360 RepID=UPI00219D974B|nr:hypothetical protein EDD37DRAFT_608231 [Exophiala viscosa]